MTRFLLESLGAVEPYFSAGLRKLEAVSGNPSHDIRFSAEINQATKLKVRQLGLDPDDTTPAELYHVLLERLKADDARLTRKLRSLAATHISAEGDVTQGMNYALKNLPDTKSCFALKPAKLKAIIKQTPPKKTLKQLGYRSVDSMLKHEAPASILAGAQLAESKSWHSHLLEHYKKLQPGDFENRSITITAPDSARWKKFAAHIVRQNKHNLVAVKEAGALILLPLPEDLPSGAVLASLGLALNELNEIRSSSSYLKLCQVRPDFGRMVQVVATEEPVMSFRLLDTVVPWHLVQKFSARFKKIEDSLTDLHIQLDDLVWLPIEETLATIDKDLEFWKDSSHLAQLHEAKPVSLNILDVALNCCNNLDFKKRVAHHLQQSMWQELLLRYLKPEVVERSLLNEVQPKLAVEEVPA